MLSSHVEEVAAWKSASNVNGSMSEARFILSVLTPQVLVSHSHSLSDYDSSLSTQLIFSDRAFTY